MGVQADWLAGRTFFLASCVQENAGRLGSEILTAGMLQSCTAQLAQQRLENRAVKTWNDDTVPPAQAPKLEGDLLGRLGYALLR